MKGDRPAFFNALVFAALTGAGAFGFWRVQGYSLLSEVAPASEPAVMLPYAVLLTGMGMMMAVGGLGAFVLARRAVAVMTERDSNLKR